MTVWMLENSRKSCPLPRISIEFKPRKQVNEKTCMNGVCFLSPSTQ